MNSTDVPEAGLAVRARRLGDRVVLGTHLEDVWELSAVGADVWLQIDGKRSVGEIANHIARLYDVTTVTALDDVKTFLQELIDDGVVVVVET